MYTFNQSSGSAAQYEAHSDAQVCQKIKIVSFWQEISLHAKLNILQGKKDLKKYQILGFLWTNVASLFKLSSIQLLAKQYGALPHTTAFRQLKNRWSSYFILITWSYVYATKFLENVWNCHIIWSLVITLRSPGFRKLN